MQVKPLIPIDLIISMKQEHGDQWLEICEKELEDKKIYPGDLVNIEELKRLIESHKLVYAYKSLIDAKQALLFLNDSTYQQKHYALQQAIYDVETCGASGGLYGLN